MARSTYRWLYASTLMFSSPLTTPLLAASADVKGVIGIAKVELSKDRSELRRLREEGYDIAGVNIHNGTADVILRGEHESLALHGLGMNVLAIHSVDSTLAPDSGYKTPDQIGPLLQDWANRYPNLVHVESIGKSLEGRDIWAAKISSSKTHATGKPAILYNSEHHAREVMSVEVVLDTGDYLLTNYGHDPKVTKWVDDNDIWLMPMVNPDGSNMVWTSDNMWRKNTRDGIGVDINRNYPYKWAACQGSNSLSWADDYHGASAASEPETQVMMAFIDRIQPVFDISYHSYSEVVIYPYGCSGEHAEGKDVIEPIGKAMADVVPSETGSGNYAPGTAWELLYAVDGDDIDWMYHEQHVLAYAIEVTSDQSGFQPPFSKRQATVEALRPAWQVLLDKAERSGIRGRVHNSAGLLNNDAVVSVQGTSALATSPGSWPIKHDGTFHVVVGPGTYRVTVTSHEKAIERMVTVGDDRVDLDLEL